METKAEKKSHQPQTEQSESDGWVIWLWLWHPLCNILTARPRKAKEGSEGQLEWMVGTAWDNGPLLSPLMGRFQVSIGRAKARDLHSPVNMHLLKNSHTTCRCIILATNPVVIGERGEIPGMELGSCPSIHTVGQEYRRPPHLPPSSPPRSFARANSFFPKWATKALGQHQTSGALPLVI